MKAIMTIGVGGSGKSTLANSLEYSDYAKLERDAIRKNICRLKVQGFTEHTNIWSQWKYSWEKDVTTIYDSLLEALIADKKPLILSDTHLNIGRRAGMKKRLEDAGYDVEYVVVGKELSLDDLWKRNLARINVLPHHVVAEQYYKFRKEFPKYQLKDVTNMSKAILCDLDGTFFDMGDRSPYEWDKVDLDTPNEIMIHTLYGMFLQGYQIIFLSGRDSVCREMTTLEIQAAMMKYYPSFNFQLFMRPADDQRKDTIIKEELFFNHIDGNYKVEAVFDDRPVVCRTWYDFGFRVYHLSNPWLEF